ncbi:methyltransferase domain-containing protein [Anaerolineales bacterium HSG24]|nr:methyltransferase domain-containing protein [Anaerolineales bacterium HSG24]
MSVEEIAKKINNLNITNVKVALTDAQHAGLANASFDLILLYGVVPALVISMKQLNKEMHRLLKSAGILAVWTFAPFWPPKTITKNYLFSYLGENDGVHKFKRRK